MTIRPEPLRHTIIEAKDFRTGHDLYFENEFTVRDAITLTENGEVVARVHVTYDFTDVPVQYSASVPLPHPVRWSLEYFARMKERQRQYIAWRALPWWKRMFARRPW